LQRGAGQRVKNQEFLDTLAGASLQWLPPSVNAMQELIWGMFNQDGDSSFSRADVERVVRNEGGNAAEAGALWAVLSPDGEKTVTAQKFATNSYLTVALGNMQASIRTDVDEARFNKKLADIKSGSVLDFSFGDGQGGGSSIGSNVLDINV